MLLYSNTTNTLLGPYHLTCQTTLDMYQWIQLTGEKTKCTSRINWGNIFFGIFRSTGPIAMARCPSVHLSTSVTRNVCSDFFQNRWEYSLGEYN